MPAGGTSPPESRLLGGTSNRNLVLRIGDTVRRPQSVGSPAVHAVLEHLAKVGFDGAPRFLGIDEQGREVLSYIEGEAATHPHPAWALTDAALASVAKLLRRYHQAIESFDATSLTWLTTVPPEFQTGLISHNDPNLDNIVFRGGEAVSLIDFDLASPGSVLWDLAITARLWVPLRDPSDITDQRASRTMERLRLLADAYGLPSDQRMRLASTATRTHEWCYDIVRAGAEGGSPGYLHYWTPAAQQRDDRGHNWLRQNAAELDAEL